MANGTNTHVLQYQRPPPLRCRCWVTSCPAALTDPSGGCRPPWRVPAAGQPPGTDDHCKPPHCPEDNKSMFKLIFIPIDLHPKKDLNQFVARVYVVMYVSLRGRKSSFSTISAQQFPVIKVLLTPQIILLVIKDCNNKKDTNEEDVQMSRWVLLDALVLQIIFFNPNFTSFKIAKINTAKFPKFLF